ncbi:MAG: MBL fold metallo-hydrolase [Thermodesulfobacteriota bacterium]
MITRKIIATMAILIALAGAPAPAPAGQADEVVVKAIPVTKQIFMISGDGGNIGLFIGADGTFLIDDQYAPLTEKIIAAIKSVGGDMPKFLLNTHYHADHTGGNEKLGGSGALIFSHDNVRQRLKSGAFIAAFAKKIEPLAQEGLPVVTFTEEITFHLNNDTVQVIHAPQAHTDGDSFIHFKKANVIHAGDLFFNGFYPFIDVDHGGSLAGTIKGVDQLLALSDNKTKIIAGHGPMGNKAQLKKYRQMLATAYDRLAKLKAAGKSAQEAAAAKPLADLEAEWGDGLFPGERWIEIIYSGI